MKAYLEHEFNTFVRIYKQFHGKQYLKTASDGRHIHENTFLQHFNNAVTILLFTQLYIILTSESVVVDYNEPIPCQSTIYAGKQ